MPEEILQQGHLILIQDYQFQDGNDSKDKFLIVLNRNDEFAYIIHTLTTSQNKLNLPSDNFGCSVVGNIPYFFIQKEIELGRNKFSFSKDTFIFFRNNVRKENLSSFLKYDKSNLILKEKLPNSFLKRLLKCMLKSDFINLDIEKELIEMKEQL
ncbi:hypothetical protein [Flavobacterium sp.]|uniref:hypothetical protein n=1 Tax=Flavobacterium sp. TaxID=239 RepID=UPI0032657A09